MTPLLCTALHCFAPPSIQMAGSALCFACFGGSIEPKAQSKSSGRHGNGMNSAPASPGGGLARHAGQGAAQGTEGRPVSDSGQKRCNRHVGGKRYQRVIWTPPPASAPGPKSRGYPPTLARRRPIARLELRQSYEEIMQPAAMTSAAPTERQRRKRASASGGQNERPGAPATPPNGSGRIDCRLAGRRPRWPRKCPSARAGYGA
jgi:hypothetical protein